jgi:hypothetical protein
MFLGVLVGGCPPHNHHQKKSVRGAAPLALPTLQFP